MPPQSRLGVPLSACEARPSPPRSRLRGGGALSVDPPATSAAPGLSGVVAGARRFGTRSKKRKNSGRSRGTRGSRGHGWYLKYKAGEGGRHLQGRWNIDAVEMSEWNDQVMGKCSDRPLLYFDLDYAREEDAQAPPEMEGGQGQGDGEEPSPEEEEEEPGQAVEIGRIKVSTAACLNVACCLLCAVLCCRHNSPGQQPPPPYEPHPQVELASTLLPLTCGNFVSRIKQSPSLSGCVQMVEKGVGVVFSTTDSISDHVIYPLKRLVGEENIDHVAEAAEYDYLSSLVQVHNADSSVVEDAADITCFRDGEAHIMSFAPAGVLAMVRETKRGTSTTKFLITTEDGGAKHLQGTGIVFGRIVGEESAKALEKISAEFTIRGRPSKDIRIVGSGFCHD